MYLKSIEVHGFKSFANKIVFQFHDGITGIVGPNGSGKSNVADAVRWVLGEQSAKQLRGSKMEDVIFSGTQMRKPMGYAYVAITLDNSDHRLPIAYEEVTIARRVYRSGESEYLINGTTCRLRDVQELFQDTGIGKEGYSIIGQGQVDKILSGKPEDRRELFDEAAGIVKYKKRKAAAEKELAEEQQNLSRISDILSEIEKQVGPLQKQSEIAKEYLQRREQLKQLEIALFLLDYERNETSNEELKKKNAIVNEDLDETKRQYDSTKQEYDRLEAEIDAMSAAINVKKDRKNEVTLLMQKTEGEISLMEEKISSLRQSDEHYAKRTAAIAQERAARQMEQEHYEEEHRTVKEQIAAVKASQEEAVQELQSIRTRIAENTKQMEDCNQLLLHTMKQDTEIKTRLQHFETLQEQNSIKKSELAQKVLLQKSEETAVTEAVQEEQSRLKKLQERIAEKKAELQKQEQQSAELRSKGEQLAAEQEKVQRGQMELSSRLEALRNLTERYEGYGNSIRKVMEQKKRNTGILGVVADLIKVEPKYETAIETALGGSIQNIVTKDEATAKQMVEFLKENRFGRATFLPLTSITARDQGSGKEQTLSEAGVIGYAHKLVQADKEYEELLQYLLGRILVVDQMEHALTLARKYHYSLRIVTLEGEQLNPGGSLSGGAYKNNSNLLGRRREMEDGEQQLLRFAQQLSGLQESRERIRSEKEQLRTATASTKEQLQQLFLEQNTARLRLEQEERRLSERKQEFAVMEREAAELEQKNRDNRSTVEQLKAQLEKNRNTRAEAKEMLEKSNLRLEQDRREEQTAGEKSYGFLAESSGMEQNLQFLEENLLRVRSELQKLTEEESGLKEEARSAKDRRKEQEAGISSAREAVQQYKEEVLCLDEQLKEEEAQKEKITQGHRNFFQRREDLSGRIMELDKEQLRLTTQQERLMEAMNAQCNYMWEEYQMTVEAAKQYQANMPHAFSYTATKKEIADCRQGIRALGDVNVNAIEEYKKVLERFTLYSAQRSDLLEAEEKLRGIIGQLDDEMRRQFEEKFAAIRDQFDLVFRELFGGGKGNLELMEEEDILEAGIRIIAQPPGKKLQNMMQLSGGEKALTAIALLFAIQNLKPSPFCLLDEIEAALDDSNVGRYAKYLHKLTKHTQFIVITHRRGTMAAADVLYGITMQEKGVSTLVSVNLIEDALDQ